jgi:hypothetical protein
MPILTQCPHCEKKFRAPDQLAGKAVKCPGCQGAVRVPAADGSAGSSHAPDLPGSASASWYILTENRQQMGPVSKEHLDNLATKGRLSFCQIRRSDWRAWKWADDFYPELPAPERKAEPAAPAPNSEEQDAARLVLCPDCGNTVSRRATQCPHCGCPAAVLLKQATVAADVPVAARPPAPDGATAAAAEAGSASPPSGSWRLYAAAGGTVLLLVTGAAVWWVVHAGRVAEPTAPIAVAPNEPEPGEPAEALLSPEDKRACIDEAARKMAEHIDELHRQYHLPLSMISQTVESVKMLEALAGGNLDAIPESTSAVPGGRGVEPYKSQIDELFIECRDWVRENVQRGECTAKDVWGTAQQWAREKQESILEPLGGMPAVDLTPSPIPDGP